MPTIYNLKQSYSKGRPRALDCVEHCSLRTMWSECELWKIAGERVRVTGRRKVMRCMENGIQTPQQEWSLEWWNF